VPVLKFSLQKLGNVVGGELGGKLSGRGRKCPGGNVRAVEMSYTREETRFKTSKQASVNIIKLI